jgi:hypothetical protein
MLLSPVRLLISYSSVAIHLILIIWLDKIRAEKMMQAFDSSDSL